MSSADNPSMSDASQSNLAGMAAVVTGSSSGIGRAIALELAAAGCHILIHGRSNRDGAERVAALARKQGVQVHVELCDFDLREALPAFVERAWQWRQGIDIWVNNAGADVLTGPAASWSFEQKLDALWRIDVVAAIELSRAAGAKMVAHGQGTIINVSWDRALHGMAGDTGQLFAATKGAVQAFSASLARSLAPSVRVNCVAPGWIKTKWGEQASEKWHQRARDESLMGRWGTPEDVAAAVRYLASPAASFITGQTLAVNGGLKP